MTIRIEEYLYAGTSISMEENFNNVVMIRNISQ